MLLYHYHYAERENFGDCIGPDVVQHLTGAEVIPASMTRSGKLVTVGSVLHAARRGDTIWGTGVHPLNYRGIDRRRLWRRLLSPAPIMDDEVNVIAVRGPITREYILERGVKCPPVYGDPGIFAPQVFPLPLEQVWEYAILPHYGDMHLAAGHPYVISPMTTDWRNVARQIVQCKRLVTSSLHGIIVAEAYGVPASWVRVAGSEGVLKYFDFYLGTGRSGYFHDSVDAALASPPPGVPDFTQLRGKLRSALTNWLAELK